MNVNLCDLADQKYTKIGDYDDCRWDIGDLDEMRAAFYLGYDVVLNNLGIAQCEKLREEWREWFQKTDLLSDLYALEFWDGICKFAKKDIDEG